MDTCPNCGAEDISFFAPRTVCACGASDYDGRPGTYTEPVACQTRVQENGLASQTVEYTRIVPWFNGGDGKEKEIITKTEEIGKPVAPKRGFTLFNFSS